VAYCCGDSFCDGAENSSNCALDCGAPAVCGDGTCNGNETSYSCAADCGTPPATEVGLCADGIDNDCDGLTDSADPDCQTCLPIGTSCTTDNQCCSVKCRGPAGNKTCK
jgi:hypothetical protein